MPRPNLADLAPKALGSRRDQSRASPKAAIQHQALEEQFDGRGVNKEFSLQGRQGGVFVGRQLDDEALGLADLASTHEAIVTAFARLGVVMNQKGEVWRAGGASVRLRR